MESLKSANSSLERGLLPFDFQMVEIRGLQEADDSVTAYGFAMVVVVGFADGEDSYSYLNLEMVLENGDWKVNNCGMEK